MTSKVTEVPVRDKTLNGLSEKATQSSSAPATATSLSTRSSQLVGAAVGDAVGGAVVFEKLELVEKNSSLVGADVGAVVGVSVGRLVVPEYELVKNVGGLVGAAVGVDTVVMGSQAQAMLIVYLHVCRLSWEPSQGNGAEALSAAALYESSWTYNSTLANPSTQSAVKVPVSARGDHSSSLVHLSSPASTYKAWTQLISSSLKTCVTVNST